MTGRDDGVAAIEMALVTGLLLLLGFGALPILTLAHNYQRVNNASADTLRYATSVDANGHTTTNGDYTRRPTTEDIMKFAQAASQDPTYTVTVTLCPGGDMTRCSVLPISADASTAASGDTVQVTVNKDVDLGLIGSLANAVASLVGQGGIAPQGTVQMSSTSSGREE